MAIVALWAAVLIPMWLRRHDDDQARRIERHRVAMGTLARMSEDLDVAPAAASRRRRLVLACTATVGALGAAAWVAGMSPGLLTAALWLPFAVFLPVALVLERRQARAAATRALAVRRDQRAARAAVAETAPAESASEQAGTPESSRTAAPGMAIPVRSTVPWDEVFDQSA